MLTDSKLCTRKSETMVKNKRLYKLINSIIDPDCLFRCGKCPVKDCTIKENIDRKELKGYKDFYIKEKYPESGISQRVLKTCTIQRFIEIMSTHVLEFPEVKID